jgi:hypothetical protein
MKLEGRVAGPWADELNRVWLETSPRLAARKLVIDIHNVTFADATGKRVLRSIYGHTRAELITNSPWTKFLAEEVTAKNVTSVEEGD